jgi:tetratricopeptide (TPR) repeat protein
MDHEKQIRSALASVLEDPAFKQSPMMSKFLIYIVEETIAGRSEKLKGYTIAIEALGKSDQFDPQVDPTVRVIASRVRRALELTAARPAAGQSIRITLPSGRYVPLFEAVSPQSGASTALDPPSVSTSVESSEWPETQDGERALPDVSPGSVVAGADVRVFSGRRQVALAVVVLAVVVIGAAGLWLRSWQEPDLDMTSGVGGPYIPYPDRMNGPHASALLAERPFVEILTTNLNAQPGLLRFAERLSNALARFDDLLDVVQPGDPRIATRATYVVSFHPVATNDVDERAVATIDVRVTRAESRRIVWVRSVIASDLDEPAALAGIVESIATELAVPYGVLFADLRATRANEAKPADTQFPCVHLALDYWQHYGSERNAAVIRCLETAIATKPDFAAAHANLAMAQIEAYRNHYTAEAPALLDLAHAHALQAIQLAPASARARQSLVAVMFAKGDHTGGLESSRRAVALNPFDGEIRADYGARLVQAGFYQDGEAELRAAMAHAALMPPWHWLFLFVTAELKGEEALANAYAGQIVSNDYPMGLLARTIVARRTGREADANRYFSRLKELDPVLAGSPGVALRRRGYKPEVIDALMKRLSLAGISETAQR